MGEGMLSKAGLHLGLGMLGMSLGLRLGGEEACGRVILLLKLLVRHLGR